MTCVANRFLRVVLASVAGIACLFGSGAASLTDPGSWTTKAQAVIGRPATPMSYAGVARRTTVAPGVGAGAPGHGVAPGVGAGAAGVGVARGAGAVGVGGAAVGPAGAGGVGNRGGAVNRAGRH